MKKGFILLFLCFILLGSVVYPHDLKILDEQGTANRNKFSLSSDAVLSASEIVFYQNEAGTVLLTRWKNDGGDEATGEVMSPWTTTGADISYSGGDVIIGNSLEVSKIQSSTGVLTIGADTIFPNNRKVYFGDAKSSWIYYDSVNSATRHYHNSVQIMEIK